MRRFLFDHWNAFKRKLAGRGFERIPYVLHLSRWVSALLTPSQIVPVKVNGYTLWVDPRDKTGVAPPLLQYGEYNPVTTALFSRFIKEGMTVLDIGANVGYFTLLAAKLVGPQGKVYAFEPAPRNYEMLTKNIAFNDYWNCIPTSKAASNKNGTTELYLDKTNWGAHSFGKRNVRGTEMIRVETARLDDYLKKHAKDLRVDFIKSDAQGAEGLILEGMKNILQKNKHLTMVLEFWPFGLRNAGTDPRAFLHSLYAQGFRISRINDVDNLVPVKEKDIDTLVRNEESWTMDILVER